MDAQQERLEVEAVRTRDDDLPVDDAALREVCLQGGRELREVAVERLQVAALDERLIAVAEDDRTETVPLGLEEPAVALGERGGWLGQHRLDGRLEGEAEGHGPDYRVGGDGTGATGEPSLMIRLSTRPTRRRPAMPRRDQQPAERAAWGSRG